jgi:GGDEF domain-containing protein
VVLCDDLADPAQADVIAARAHVAMSEPFVLTGAEVLITASIGVALTGTGDHSPEQLITTRMSRCTEPNAKVAPVWT